MARRNSRSTSRRSSGKSYNRRSNTRSVRSGRARSGGRAPQTVRLVIQQEAPSVANPTPLSERISSAAQSTVKPGKAKF